MVAENQGCSNSPVIRLGSDSPIWSNNEATRNITIVDLHDNVNCDDPVDRNGFKDVNCDAAGHGVEDVNWDDDR